MKLLYKLFATLTILWMELSDLAYAGNIRVDDFKNTSGAGTKRLDDMLNSAGKTGQSVLDFVIIIFTVVGVIVCGISLYALYQASKDEREKPKAAIVGLFVGGALTAVGLVTGYMANTVGV